MKRINVAVVLLLLSYVGSFRTNAFAQQMGSDAGSTGAILTGAVKGANGNNLEGVPVSARAEGEPIRTTVYTDDSGTYIFPPLHAGHYSVSAQAVGFELTHQDVDLDTKKEARADLTLKTVKDFTEQLSAPEWMAALPEDTRENRRGKSLLRNNCTGCHPANWVLQNRFDEAGWTRIIDYMEKTNAYGNRPSPDGPPYDAIMRYFKPDLAAYLARMRGPGPSPMKFQPFPRPRGESAMVVVTEYDIPNGTTGKYVTADGTDWSEGTPSLYEARGPHDAYPDSNGIVWIATTDDDRTAVRLDPKNGQTKNIVVRDRRGSVMSSHGIVVDSKDIVWFNAGGGLVRLDSKTEKTDWFEPPKEMARVGGSLAVDPQGFVWAATNTGAIRFDPETNKFTDFHSVDPRAPTYGVGADSEGNGWWAQLEIGILGKSDIRTGKSTEVVLDRKPVDPTLFSETDRKVFQLSGSTNNSTPPGEEGPRRLSGDRNGHIWVGDWWGNNFAKVDIKTNKVTYYPLPGIGASPYQIWGTYATAVDKDGMVWGNLQNYDEVAKLDPKTGKWTLYPLPTLGTETRHISVDNHRDSVEVWVPYWRTNKMARLQFRTKKQLDDLRAALTAQK